MTITDFNVWLECAELEDYEEIYCLYHSVAECSEYGMFNTQIAAGENNGWIVRASYLDEALHLCSEKARNAFLSIIENRYCEGMGVEGWYTYNKVMEKDD